jgi:hypothetical protein
MSGSEIPPIGSLRLLLTRSRLTASRPSGTSRSLLIRCRLNGTSPCGHVAFAPVQTTYKPSVVLSKPPTSLRWFCSKILKKGKRKSEGGES